MHNITKHYLPKKKNQAPSDPTFFCSCHHNNSPFPLPTTTVVTTAISCGRLLKADSCWRREGNDSLVLVLQGIIRVRVKAICTFSSLFGISAAILGAQWMLDISPASLVYHCLAFCRCWSSCSSSFFSAHYQILAISCSSIGVLWA